VKIERSAGVLLYRDTPEEGRLFLLLDYGSHWDYPKGHVEEGEDDVTAARRELREETGIVECDLVDGFAREITYFFRSRKGGLIKKTVVFFLGRTSVADVVLSHEHVGFAWLTEADALRRVSYANAKALMKDASMHLSASDSSRL
jgi:bis(5'-nucleosidyl)-tetraphosphatase